jgi:RimJ/RimL family protein N-acetyltransferase
VSDAYAPFDFAAMFAALAPADGVFPEEEITTRRLLLRAYAEADVEDHTAMFDHDIVRVWASEPQPYTPDHSRAWCTRTASEIRTTGEGICWAVTDRGTGRLLGCTGFHHTDWRNRVTEISAVGAPWAVGQGYAKEALRAISRWALQDQRFRRLQITAAVGNLPPQRVAAACGFRREGVLRNAGSSNFGPADLVMYSLIPADLETTEPTEKDAPCQIGTA